MSFLNTNNSEFISARVTQKGRNAIAKGSFNIEYFQVGDSEFDYDSLFATVTGQTKHQMVMAPFDKEAGVKYPYRIDATSGSTTYGVPVEQASTESIRNVMGPAGFVSNYYEYDPVECTGSTIFTQTEVIYLSSFVGTNQITVTSGSTYEDAEYIMLVLGEFGGTDPNVPVIKANNTSFIYKITDITGNVLTLDRELPDITSYINKVQILAIGGEIEYTVNSTTDTCLPQPIDNLDQQNPWRLNIAWDEKPIGANNDGDDDNIATYNSAGFVSTKELLGYNTDSQTFTDLSGGSITYPTAYKNSFDENILVAPEKQRAIAIVHFSELGDILYNPERFFKYDDYISHNDNVSESIYTDINDIALSDTEYFEVFIPFIHYHRDTTTTTGALFTMGDTDYYVNSTINERHQLKFRYLEDVNGNNVGKVFVNNKIVVFDDQELVAMLEFRSNRRHTLPAPKLGLVPSDEDAASSMITGSTGTTMWVTYALEDASTSDPLNSLPCNYYSKIDGITTPSNLTIKFGGGFDHMKTTMADMATGFVARKFYVLLQETAYGELPTSDAWRIVDLTTDAGGDGSSYLNPSNLINVSFILERSDYESAFIFDLEDLMGNGYTSVTEEQFGSDQPFPGSVRLVRAIDVEQMNFMINLPSNQFLETQNPTYVSGDRRLTEIALLDANKEPLVMAKTPLPVKRVGTQVFSVRIDF